MPGFLGTRLVEFGDRLAVASGDEESSYRDLSERVAECRRQLVDTGVEAGDVVTVEGDYSLESVAVFLALTEHRCIVVPLSTDTAPLHEQCRNVAMVQWRIEARVGPCRFSRVAERADHELYDEVRQRAHPGLVLFTSGSTGTSKGAVHDLAVLLEKFEPRRLALRTIVFLQLDHIGGVNTLLYTLANGGAVIAPSSRSPSVVCEAIARHRAQLLPTSPTFLNLLLLTEAYRQFDCSSLERITYGTEPMPQSTLDRVREQFPAVVLQQTYGMTELGILRSKSREDGSLWVSVGGEGFQTKVVDGRLFIKARSAMLGYLNAPDPFDADGFLDTGDAVLVDGKWLRILGRTTELINVGGHKVYPAEEESALLEVDGVRDAVVSPVPHPLMGSVVAAAVRLDREEPLAEFKRRMRTFLRDRLPPYAIPAKLTVSEEDLHSARFKRIRRRPIASTTESEV